jgi:hypothetical protein
MNVVISSGHGKYVPGAVGFIDEHEQAVRVVDRVAEFLRSAGIGVQTFHDNESHSQNENLERIVDFHNSQTRDLDVSVHFNSYETTSEPMGTECLWVTQEELAGKVSDAIAAAANLIDRGPKERTDLYFLNNTEEPAILIETCFVDSSADVDLYHQHFDDLCRAIAEAVSGQEIDDDDHPLPPDPTPPSTSSRPTIRRGDTGPHVVTVQRCLRVLPIDGDFGAFTEQAVIDYQRAERIDADGVVGPTTWAHLESDFNLPPYPPPLPPPLDDATLALITGIAERSAIASYDWEDRGEAPPGYTNGIAVAFALVLEKWHTRDTAALEMGKANTHDDGVDALSRYESIFDDLGMSNERAGIDTLRHLFVLLMGLVMRESSGRHCEGRDMSADNVSSDTAEAGLFQMSWNASSSSSEMQKLMDQYRDHPPQCALDIFREGVSCSESEWASHGSGDGYDYQALAKSCPQFAVETTAIGMRNLRQHWGPINRYEVEVMPEADQMLRAVQAVMTRKRKQKEIAQR